MAFIVSVASTLRSPQGALIGGFAVQPEVRVWLSMVPVAYLCHLYWMWTQHLSHRVLSGCPTGRWPLGGSYRRLISESARLGDSWKETERQTAEKGPSPPLGGGQMGRQPGDFNSEPGVEGPTAHDSPHSLDRAGAAPASGVMSRGLG